MATSSEKNKIIKLSTAEYTTLSTTGTLTKDGVTYTYSPSDTIYVTPDAISGLSEYKEQLRLICNRYLDSTDRLPIDCTWEELIAVFNEYDEYTYMNAFLNSIEVFPDKDYSINDTEGHIKGLRDYAFYNNAAIKSIRLTGTNVNRTFGMACFSGLTNLKELVLTGGGFCNAESFIYQAPMLNKVILKGINFNAASYYLLRELSMLTNASVIDTVNYLKRSFLKLVALKTLILTNYPTTEAPFLYGNTNMSAFEALIMIKQDGVSPLPSSSELLSTNMPNVVVYVPSALLSQYQSATNWTAVNSAKPIQQIESNINSLRELGADFSFTQYANKKWDGSALVDDATIGEEVSE